MTEEKEKNVFYITHSGEALFWLIVILVMSVLFSFTHIFKQHSDNEYNIFMPDVDGLIVGSPVRTMGIEVGHVTDIKPIKDEVFVKFLITDKTVKLPQGTIATVEFSGMAGSKSLELYLPDKDTYIDSTVPILTVNPPNRLSDAAGLLNEMFKKIGNIIAVTSRFGTQLNTIDFPEGKNGNINDAKDFIKFADDLIDKQQKRVDDLGSKLNERRKKK